MTHFSIALLHSLAFQPLAFTGHPGLTLQLSDVDDPLETFERFIDDAMVAMVHVVAQTNLRARQLASAPGIKMSSRIRKWKDVSAEELRVFLAILMYMGIFHKPESWMYS